MKRKRKHLIEFLIKELGGVEKVKHFSSLLKSLNLCNLTEDNDLEKVAANGGVILQTLVTWYMLGFLDKLNDIKKLIKE